MAVILQFVIIAALGVLDLVKGIPLHCSTSDMWTGKTQFQACASFFDFFSQRLIFLVLLNVLLMGLPTIGTALLIFLMLLIVHGGKLALNR